MRYWALLAIAIPLLPLAAHADDKQAKPEPRVEESVVRHAREMVDRAKFLEEAAAVDEKAAWEIAKRIDDLRQRLRVAKDRVLAAKDTDRDKDALVAKAEEIDADLVVSEAEVITKRRAVIENRRVARDLRAAAVKMVKEAPIDALRDSRGGEPASLAWACNPPFSYDLSGRKIYRLQCLDRGR